MTSRAFTCALILLPGFLSMAVQTDAQAQGTTVSGSISATTTWTTAGSPYRVSADLSIAPDVTLTIQPGVTILLNAAVNFTINGGVIARVAAGQPIIFTSVKDSAGQTPAPGDWGQIRIINSSNILSDFDGVEFRYGSGLVISGASPLLNRIAIRNMAGPAISVDLAASPRGVDISASGNILNGISVPAGDISGNITWAITGIPYVLQSGILGVGASASISSISPNVFAIGQTADATIIGNGLTTVESLSSDRAGVSVTLRPGAWQSAIPITVAVPSDATPGSAIITAVVGAGTVSVPITITSNLPPLVTLTAPQTGAEYTAPATVSMSATASSQNANGLIRQVDFYQGSTFIRTATTPVNGVYSADWTEAPAGTYSITARAIDNFGAVTSSAPVEITVFSPPNISLTSPTQGLFASPGVIAFRATASSNVPGITIAKVEFLNWGFQTTISTVTTPQSGVYSYDWNLSSGGYNEVRARATDSRGAVSYTSIIVLTGITPPDVSITAPTNNAIFIAPAALTISASASSIWGPSYAVTIAKVEFYENGNLIGTANTGTGGVFSIAWTKSVNGAYAITAKATDSVGGTKVSSPITIKVGSAPTVTLTAPTEGAAFAVGTTIPLNATAAVQFVGGTIAKVEFFSGTTLIATTTTGGAGGVYSANWIGATAGNYAITAKATDDQGQTSISNAASIQVNAPPSITLTSPTSNAIFNAPATVTLTATASSSNNAGSVSKVEFFQGTTLIGTATINVGGVFTASWENVAAGNYSITAKATDNTSQTRTTSSISIQVNAPPVVTITAPANNASFNPGQLIALRATSTTPNTGGTIAKVEFSQGATSIGTATTAVAGVYGFDWINSIGGSYSITAKATDAAGLTAVSTPILLRTNNTPSVAIAYPANGAIVAVGSQINGTATSNNPGATISKVEFFAGAELIGVATEYNGLYYTNLPSNLVGLLSITARATDSLGAVATSQAISASAKLKPTVSITSPIDNTTFLSSTPIVLKATATSPNPGSAINFVNFYNDDTGVDIGLGVLANGEYAYSVNGFASGTYRIGAYAYDSDAIYGFASPVTILVIDPPTVAITAPATNASFVAPATIALTVSATSANAGGSITKVEVFAGSALIGQAIAGALDTYTYNWMTVPIGSYVITAKATDNNGNVTTSTPITLQVTAAPLAALNVSLVTPAGTVPVAATRILGSVLPLTNCAAGIELGTIQLGSLATISVNNADTTITNLTACQGNNIVAARSVIILPGQATTAALTTTSLSASAVAADNQIPNALTKLWVRRADDINNIYAVLIGTVQSGGATTVAIEAIPLWSGVATEVFASIAGNQIGSATLMVNTSANNVVTLRITQITGSVTLLDGTAVSSPLVTAFNVVGGTSTQTGAAMINPATGNFIIYGAAIGAIDVLAQDPTSGLADSKRVNVADSMTIYNTALVLQASGKVTGIVTNSAGAPLSGINVGFFNQIIFLNAFSDAAGRYTFDNVPLGPFDLEVLEIFGRYGTAPGQLMAQGQTLTIDIPTKSWIQVSGIASNNGIPSSLTITAEPALNFIGSSPFGVSTIAGIDGTFSASAPTGPLRLIASDPNDLFRKGLLLLTAPETGIQGVSIVVGNAIGFGFQVSDVLYRGQPYSLRGMAAGAESYPLSCDGTVMGALRLTSVNNYLACTSAAGINADRDEVSFGPYWFSGVSMDRRVYVPLTGASYARVIDTLTNTTSAAVAKDYHLDQYADIGYPISPITIDSSSIQLVDRGDVPNALPYLKMVKHGVGRQIEYVGNKLTLIIPAGESVSIVSYLVSRTSCNTASDLNSICVVAEADQVATNLFNGTQPGMFKGLTAADRANTRNFNIPTP